MDCDSNLSSQNCSNFDISDGRVVRAFACGAVDSGLIVSRVEPTTLKFTASLLNAQQLALKRQCGEQAGKFTCAVRKSPLRDFPILEW